MEHQSPEKWRSASGNKTNHCCNHTQKMSTPEQSENEPIVDGKEVVARAWTVTVQQQLLMAGTLLRNHGVVRHVKRSGAKAAADSGVDSSTDESELLALIRDATIDSGATPGRTSEFDMLAAIDRTHQARIDELDRSYQQEWRGLSELEAATMRGIDSAAHAGDRPRAEALLSELRQHQDAKMRLLQHRQSDTRISHLRKQAAAEKAAYIGDVQLAYANLANALGILLGNGMFRRRRRHHRRRRESSPRHRRADENYRDARQSGYRNIAEWSDEVSN